LFKETLEDGGSPTTLPSNSARCATYRLYQWWETRKSTFTRTVKI